MPGWSILAAAEGCSGMPVGRIKTDDCRARAVECAERVAAESERRSVEVVVTGSLCDLKYAIEGIVEDELGNVPFNVVYREKIPPSRLDRFMEGAVNASDLG